MTAEPSRMIPPAGWTQWRRRRFPPRRVLKLTAPNHLMRKDPGIAVSVPPSCRHLYAVVLEVAPRVRTSVSNGIASRLRGRWRALRAAGSI